MPKYAHLRPLLTLKWFPQFLVMENSKKVHFLVPKEANIASPKKSEKGILSGARKCHNVLV